MKFQNETGRRTLRALAVPIFTGIAAALMAPLMTGCVTVAEFRKLEREARRVVAARIHEPGVVPQRKLDRLSEPSRGTV